MTIVSCAIVPLMGKTPFEPFQAATAKILSTPKDRPKKHKAPPQKVGSDAS
jgi:hypothetical protein